MRTAAKTKEIRLDKREAVQEIGGKFEKAKIAIFTDYQGSHGLSVKELQSLRRKLRENRGEFKVVKNTLVRKALQELKIEGLTPYLEKASAIAFGYEDPVVVAKTLLDFAKDHKTSPSDPGLPLVKAGWLDRVVVEAKQIHHLATLPSRNVLLSQLLGTMKSPMTGMVTVFTGTLRSLINVLDAIRRGKEANQHGNQDTQQG